MNLLHTVAWVVAIVYSTIPCFWLVIHPRARKLGSAERPLAMAGAIWFGMWVAMGAVTWPFRDLLLYQWQWSWVAASPLFLAGFTVYALAKQRFTADQLLGRTELHPDKHEQRLVTAGVRQYVRHPIYVGHFLELLAWCLGSGMTVIFAMTAFAAITGLLMVRAEDRELEQRFGLEYRAYRLRVPAFLPRVRRGDR